MFADRRLFLCSAILTKRIAQTKACQTQTNDSYQAFDGNHNQKN